jgi:hypothetical protein
MHLSMPWVTIFPKVARTTARALFHDKTAMSLRPQAGSATVNTADWHLAMLKNPLLVIPSTVDAQCHSAIRERYTTSQPAFPQTFEQGDDIFATHRVYTHTRMLRRWGRRRI